MLHITYILLSIILSALTVYFTSFNPFLIIVFFAAYFVGLVLLHIIVLGVAGLFVNGEKEFSTFVQTFLVVSLKLATDILGIRIRTEGFEKLPEHSKFLLVSNHRSFLDPIIGIICFKKYKISYIAKKELINAPFITGYMKRMNFMWLDRDDARAAIKTINDAAQLIAEGNQAVAIYPEGTRHTGDGILELKHGSFKIALKAKSGLAVTVIQNTDKVFKRFPFRTTNVHIKCAGYISAEEVQNMTSAQLAQKATELMLANL